MHWFALDESRPLFAFAGIWRLVVASTDSFRARGAVIDRGLKARTPIVQATGARHALAAVAPIWDGNETWLVVTAVILWGAFPVAYQVSANSRVVAPRSLGHPPRALARVHRA